ncbi:uncharacterized protein LOC107048917 [Diachasma alloeum]|uniref:uncharacterized protein LOC107048917 n=1 Tax=Diachasma alloeum TaxID=454923 RepID=UPI0007384E90|nr:uncharacterized protein LOC107048917 [Diachasma alloeum]
MKRTLETAGFLVASFFIFVVTQRVECYPQKWPPFYSPEGDTSRISELPPSSPITPSREGKRDDDESIVTASAVDPKQRGDSRGDAELSEDMDEETKRVLEEAFRTSLEDLKEFEDKSKSRPVDEMHLRRYDFKHGIRPGNLVPYIGDRIVFPENGVMSSVKKDRRGPTCRRGTFCEDTPSYPIELINRAIRSDTNLKYLQVKDELEATVSLRTSGLEEVLCESKKQLVRPRVAKNKNSEWRYIVNTDNFTQAIGVETCDNNDSPCKLVDNFAGGYRTMCKQNYIYRELVAVGSDNKIATEKFQIPASCCCHVQFIGDPTLRMGTNLQKSDS